MKGLFYFLRAERYLTFRKTGRVAHTRKTNIKIIVQRQLILEEKKSSVQFISATWEGFHIEI